ncbi:winged helix-turn-helix domain-containing protein [Halogeometricum limi]|uniref:DUF7344 domain-containing protein n=1 Tax=Halogeometricum limi TaxID=555875 RepID=A0A1I6H809_9EURY|nr:helix-turn-helix domain-containing protein [Halogeometricum limi]SFR50498.1 hypothetical protein SAMN04488124_1888 [Halogeometricum limi]
MVDDGDPPKQLTALDTEVWNDVDDAPSTDALFRALANRHRRRVLWYLVDDSETTIAELADALVGWEASDNVIVGPEARRRVYVSLHHHHLPMLSQADLLTYDADSGAVRLTTSSKPVEDVIRFSHRYEHALARRDER